FARVIERHDVRMPQVRRGFDLQQEPLRTECRHHLRVEHLDGDLAFVLEVAGEIHRGHSALAKFALNAIAVGEARGIAGHWRRRYRCTAETASELTNLAMQPSLGAIPTSQPVAHSPT